MRSFCDITTSILPPFVHGPQYVVPFVFTVFSMLPPLVNGNEYVVSSVLDFSESGFHTVNVALATDFHQGGV